MTTTTRPVRRTSREVKVAAVVVTGLLAVSLLAVRVLSEVGWDVTVFASFGEESLGTRAYAEERLGSVFLRSQHGHDGRFFFIQANDPFLLDPEEHASVLDRPLYRGQRMLYPALAGGLGLLPPTVVIWAMLIVNILSLGAGTWAAALLARNMGGSPWWGLAFPLNLGFVSETMIGGAGVVAGAALLGAALLLVRGRFGWSVALLGAAVLAREAMLLAVAGVAFYLWRRGETRRALIAGVIPAAAAGIWALYVRLRISFESGASQIEEIGLPFVGFVRAFETWLSRPVNLLVGVSMMLVMALFVRRVLLRDHVVGWSAIGFVLLAVVFTEQVWRSYFDITRAIAPVITAFILLVFAGSRASGTGTGDDEAVPISEISGDRD